MLLILRISFIEKSLCAVSYHDLVREGKGEKEDGELKEEEEEEERGG